MIQDDEEPKDWEIEDQEPPEQLKRKWIVEDLKPQDPIFCPSCKKPLPYDSLSCLFCGASIYREAPDFFSRGWTWIKHFFKKRRK